MKEKENIKKMDAEYWDWLMKKIETSMSAKRYQKLFFLLRQIDFIIQPDTNLDENRALDGIGLREKFLFQEYGFRHFDEVWKEFIEYEGGDTCSVLEMLLALSVRIDSEFYGEPGVTHVADLFWEMLHNLGLLAYCDNRFQPLEVNKIVKKWLYKDYQYNGKGAILPIKNPEEDQRTLEIWDQMMRYIHEKEERNRCQKSCQK